MIPANRMRKSRKEVVLSLTVKCIGSTSYLKNIPTPSHQSCVKVRERGDEPGTPRPCSVSRDMSVTEYWFVLRIERRASM
jgi:hypothetical protein